MIYNWKRIRPKRRSFDDGSLISIRSVGSRLAKKYNKLLINRREVVQKLNAGAKFVNLYYSEKGYLGIKFSEKPEEDCYQLRKFSKVKFEVRSALLDYFQSKNYFTGDVSFEDGMAVIKIELKDKKYTPLTEIPPTLNSTKKL